MTSPSKEEGESALLSDLCTICHANPPKYRCPRCSTRTCSLPCTRRHKTWSQCSGVRDPAAYLRRNELATPAAFDRDFNFITGIERTIERADRDAENRGVHIDHDYVEGGADGEEDNGNAKKRKRAINDGSGLVKGEAGFLRGSQTSEVHVIRAPKGMTRNKQNTSRWHPKQKCLIWTVEWITPDGERRIRTCLESCRIAEAYDRFYPLPKERKKEDIQDQQQSQQQQQQQQQQEDPEQQPQPPQPEVRPEAEAGAEVQPQPQAEGEGGAKPEQEPEPEPEPTEITPHRDMYFYLHRPRTATKQPVLIPLPPRMSFTSALRRRTVLEFPTVYALAESPDSLRETGKFLLEEEYLQTEGGASNEADPAGAVEAEGETQQPSGAVNLDQVDEKKVLEVLKQDLFEPVPAGAVTDTG